MQLSGIYECWFFAKGKLKQRNQVSYDVHRLCSMTDTGLDRWITKCRHQKHQPKTSCLQSRIIPASPRLLSHLKGHCDERQCLQHCAGKPLKSSTNKDRYDCTSNKGKSSSDGSGNVLHMAVLMLARQKWGQQDKGFGALCLHMGK